MRNGGVDMTDMQEIIRTIDNLSRDELEQVQAYITQRRQRLEQIPEEDIEARIQDLMQAVATFREGLTAEDWDEIEQAMNADDVQSDDSSLFDWLDHLPKDER
jgi:hypothetical protein